MTAHAGSITAYETEKWVREVLAVTSDQISLATIKSQVKTRMHKRFFQLDVKALTATLDRLTSAKIITKTGHGTTKKYTYNQAHQQPEAFDDLAADLQQCSMTANNLQCVPHACGDEPQPRIGELLTSLCSPRLWG